jgi:hypothetical protein
MALEDMQRLLTRLVTDPSLYVRFLAQPIVVASELGFEATVATVLASIPPSQIRQYGASLLGKRRIDAAKCLPLTVRTLGPDRFGALFRNFALDFRPQAKPNPGRDAIAFTQWLRSYAAQHRVEPLWAVDLAAIEGASLRAVGQKTWTWLVSQHAPRDVLTAARAGSRSESLAIRPSLLVWLPFARGRYRTRPLVFPLPRYKSRLVYAGAAPSHQDVAKNQRRPLEMPR